MLELLLFVLRRAVVYSILPVWTGLAQLYPVITGHNPSAVDMGLAEFPIYVLALGLAVVLAVFLVEWPLRSRQPMPAHLQSRRVKLELEVVLLLGAVVVYAIWYGAIRN